MTLFQAFGQFAGAGAGAAPGIAGMDLLKPSSISVATGTGNLGTNGQITFSGASAIDVNDVFSADYTNYLLAINMVGTGSDDAAIRYRVSGTTDTTANSHLAKFYYASNTTFDSQSVTGNYARLGPFTSTNYSGIEAVIYGPFLAQTTAYHTVTTAPNSGAYLADFAGYHNQATSYDGFTIIFQIFGSFLATGTLNVYGIRG